MRAVCERQAIVWDAIERLAFQPTPPNRNGWLWCYVKSLADLWGVEHTSVRALTNTEFEFLDFDIWCKFSIDGVDRYSVSIGIAGATTSAWLLHVDPDFHSRSGFYRPDERYPTHDMPRHLERDVTDVLDGMIFHPRNHSHGDELGILSQLATEPPSLGPREIRLGGGIENGFVFLTHLRYQFCLLSNDARQEENTRLTRLFTEAIRARRQQIPAGELFGL